jgi:general stress protein 26
MSEHIKKLAEMIEGIEVAMLTTLDNDGTLRSRPMITQDEEFNGVLWFFTEPGAAKVNEVQQRHQVNLSYADPDSQRYVSISGLASLVRDPAKIDRFWNDSYELWFDGKENVALLKVEVEKAEYWDSSGNMVKRVIDFASALVTGDSDKLGDNEKINL